jgi:hypothetical protein
MQNATIMHSNVFAPIVEGDGTYLASKLSLIENQLYGDNAL